MKQTIQLEKFKVRKGCAARVSAVHNSAKRPSRQQEKSQMRKEMK